MRLLSVYVVMAVALMVCCLMPTDVLSKPLKKKHGKHGQEARGDRHEDHRKGSRNPGRGRHGEVSREEMPSNVDDETDGEFDTDGEFNHTAGPLSFDPNSPSEQTEPEDPISEGEEEEKHQRGHGNPNKNKTRGWQSRRENMPIRPRYRPNSKPQTGPLGVSEIKVDVKEQEAMRKAVGYMSTYGYMQEMDDDDWNTDTVTAKKMKKSIKMMQKFMGLKETGELDEMTMMMMDKPRCGVADMTPPAKGGNRTGNYTGGPLSFTHFGQRWDKLDITFRILNYPRTMPVAETREALLRAFKVWSDITPLTFTEIHGAQYADFYMKFGGGHHGDNYPFDGPGGTLAHAFLPKSNSGDIEGDVHFDDDEPFSYATYDGTNLFQVAAHEIGHSLGMHHSSDPTALMAPFYPGYQPTFYMPYDDLSGIQSLYGSKQVPQPYPFPYPNPAINEPTQAPVPTTTTRAPPPATRPATVKPNPTQPQTQPPAQTPTTTVSNPTDPCPSIVFDATTYWRGELFSFTGNKYGRIRDYKILSREGGSNAQYFFQNFPGDIDALYEDPVTYKLFIFKGSNYYVYNGLIRESGPTPITNIDPSLPSNIDAVVTWAADRKTYIFKGELVWRYDELTRRVDPGWPYRIDQVWRGVPNDVAAAFHNEISHLTYFLVGTDYYRYDDLYAEVDVGPRDFTADYFGCF